MSYAQFVAQFPEFDQIDQDYVAEKLAEAERANDEGAFGVMYDDACYYWAADALARSPAGSQMGLVNDNDNTTVYEHRYEKLKLRILRRMQVTGGGFP